MKSNEKQTLDDEDTELEVDTLDDVETDDDVEMLVVGVETLDDDETRGRCGDRT